MSIENGNPENENLQTELNQTENPSENQEVTDSGLQETSYIKEESDHTEDEKNAGFDAADEQQEEDLHSEDFSQISLKAILDEMEKIVNKADSALFSKRFSILKEEAQHKIGDETADKKHEFLEQGNPEEQFEYHHPQVSKLTALSNIFKEKLGNYHKIQEADQKKNLEDRLAIIERLKNLYTNSEPGINLFKSIREIKEAWGNAGQVAKSEFKNLNNNYFHHLKMFNEMLDLNKEYLEQEYAHNLEKRQHIIERAKELLNEPTVQKALNELQYLHKLWKEEAEPVAEEFREKTWEEFKEVSNKIHERKAELVAVIDSEQQANLEKKNKIIEELKGFSGSQNANHNYWQQTIKKVEDLRSEFLKTGAVPKKLSNQNWTNFKQALRDFNSSKNDFYKDLKGSQVQNLEEKLKLIQTAQDNMNSEDWETAVPLFKKLQEDWKKIGHVPRNQASKVWDDFRDACNIFFKNYREKNAAAGDNWKENYKHKKTLLDELKTLTDEEGAVEKIEQIKNSWNAIGKVPKDKISINSDFNKTLREKLKLNRINEFDLKEENLSEGQLTDKARKIKNQIAELESEIVQLENNLSFFNNPNRENPLLKDTYGKIDSKKEQLENLKSSLHNIISGE